MVMILPGVIGMLPGGKPDIINESKLTGQIKLRVSCGEAWFSCGVKVEAEKCRMWKLKPEAKF